jgi:hypothetical protein
MSQDKLSPGDVVSHPKRPEWGKGRVRTTNAVQHNGSRAQRVTVDFPNQGRVTINTAIAPLKLVSANPAASAPSKPANWRTSPQEALATKTSTATATAPSSDEKQGSGWLPALDVGDTDKREVWDLPDELTDPFATLGDRLKLTLKTYKYSTKPRSLLEWACAQTGLDDPLTQYTRSELEQAFPRYARDRDQHLKDLVRQLKRANDYPTLKACGKGLIPAAQSALDKAIRH